MTPDPRRIAVVTSGYCAFLNLYSPQALLPALAHDFGVGAGRISAVMTASSIAIALTAPFTGVVADVLGRKRVIATAMIVIAIPMVMLATATSVNGMVFWRFLQGLLLPPIFAVTVAYIGDEWPPAQVPAVAGLYVSGASLGGFSGRLIPGVLTDLIGWRIALASLAALTLIGGIAFMLLLPRERHFVRSEGFSASLRQMARHLRNPRLIAFYAVGFGVLFNFMAVFTYVNFHLAAPPYLFTPSMLGAIFVTYLAGTATAPLIGRAVDRLGRRKFVLLLLAAWGTGALLLLAVPVYVIIAGLTLCAMCGMMCQAVSTSAVTATAQEGRSSAVGLYVTSFYVGGSVGAFLPGVFWHTTGWPGVVAMTVTMLSLMALAVALLWREKAEV
jgi:MFS transporter, YNFM family, putative membrane transport protein